MIKYFNMAKAARDILINHEIELRNYFNDFSHKNADIVGWFVREIMMFCHYYYIVEPVAPGVKNNECSIAQLLEYIRALDSILKYITKKLDFNPYDKNTYFFRQILIGIEYIFYRQKVAMEKRYYFLIKNKLQNNKQDVILVDDKNFMKTIDEFIEKFEK
jgi:hypothetical protein